MTIRTRFPVPYPRTVLALTGLAALALLSYAWYLQYGPDKQQPCPLCILQRYLFMGIAAVSLAAAALPQRPRLLLVAAALLDLLATAGVVLAAWQVSKGSTMTSCLADPVGEFVVKLPGADWWPEFLFPSGGCADVYPPVLGVAVPVWSLVWFGLFAAAAGYVLVASARRLKA